jgi:hypothetical protein
VELFCFIQHIFLSLEIKLGTLEFITFTHCNLELGSSPFSVLTRQLVLDYSGGLSKALLLLIDTLSGHYYKQKSTF